jgi:SAM-dependent methyltransferase
MTKQNLPHGAHAREAYTHRESPAFDAQLAARTVARDAAFFVPHLSPGMRLLDLGCGPGSITLGLAECVAPGEVVGIDLRPEPLAQARAAAHARGITNVRFEVGSAYALPFADGSFDAAFAHVVLLHLREPVRALAEVRRVLRPGGVVGVRDPDFGMNLRFPLTPLAEPRRDLILRVQRHNGGDPLVGRRHRRLLRDAGYARTEAGATVTSVGTAEAGRSHVAFAKAHLEGMARTALAEGWTDEATLAAMAGELDAWAERPDAFSVTVWCHALGWAGG